MQNTDLSMIQQSALMGHAIHDARVYDAITGLGLNLGDGLAFADVNLQSIWKRIVEHHGRFRRHPTVDEIRATFNDEQRYVDAWNRELDAAISRRNSVGYDTIQPTLLRMAEVKVAAQGMTEASKLFTKAIDAQARHGGDAGLELHQQAMTAIQDLHLKLSNLNTLAGGSAFRSMASRSAGEAVERESRKDRIIPTGIEYLDDATGGGVGPMDLWTFSATTGSGKTQILTSIAAHAGLVQGADGKPRYKVAFFALEAEPDEIERRIKFTLLLRAYNKAHPNNRDFIDGARWRNGFDEEVNMLKPYMVQVQAEIDATLANVDTFYLGYGKYTAKDLERDVLAKSRDYDLIIVDHLGYIALDDGNENKEMTDLMFMLRDLCKRGRGIPILLAAHVRKAERTPRKFAPLMIDREDIKGTQSIIACSTHVVTISKIPNGIDVEVETSDLGKTVQYLNPTLMRLAKFRHDNRDMYTAVCGYDRTLGGYRPAYAIGKLIDGDTAWVQTTAPEWAKRATKNLKPIKRDTKKEINK